MDKKELDEVEIDLREMLYALRSRLWIIILSGIVAAVAAALISIYLMTPVYTSEAQLYILGSTESTTSLADIQVGTQLTQDYMVLIKSRPVVKQVIENLNLNISYEALANKISVSNPTNTRILKITVTYPDAFMAKAIVDKLASISADYIAEIMHTDVPSIVAQGEVPELPSGPNVKKNTAIGGVLGVLVAAAIVIIIYMMDDTIKDSDDVEKYLGLSTLGMIPIDSEAGGKSKKRLRGKKKRGI